MSLSRRIVGAASCRDMPGVPPVLSRLESAPTGVGLRRKKTDHKRSVFSCVAPRARFELATKGLTVLCATAAPPGNCGCVDCCSTQARILQVGGGRVKGKCVKSRVELIHSLWGRGRAFACDCHALFPSDAPDLPTRLTLQKSLMCRTAVDCRPAWYGQGASGLF